MDGMEPILTDVSRIRTLIDECLQIATDIECMAKALHDRNNDDESRLTEQTHISVGTELIQSLELLRDINKDTRENLVRFNGRTI